MYAVDRAGGQAEFAPRTLLLQYAVHVFASPHDGIHRAGGQAQGAANTGALINHSHGFAFSQAMCRVKGLGCASQ